MIEFTKKHDILVCMDSDGTVMDTMTIKHERCFGPCFIEVFGIETHISETIKKWNALNLYTKTRGINRFQGLDAIIEYVKQFGYTYPGSDEFHEWVISTKELSVPAINRYLESEVSNSYTFELALEWSKRVNEQIEKLPPSQPFSGVLDSIKEAYNDCDLVGVSSANPQAVLAEWTEQKLINYFAFVGCQDKGNKASIIYQALENGYDKKKTVMLGDAVGDLKAAEANGVWFFPIIPKDEVYSWKRFKQEGLIKLVNGSFDEKYQKELLDEFNEALEKGE